MKETMSSLPTANDEAVKEFFEIVSATCHDEFKEQVIPALRRRWETPPSKMVNAALDKRFSDDEVRRLLYTPTAADMALYADLLAGDPQNPNDLSNNAANRAQVLAMTHLYLVHGRVWGCLRPFIEAGGLRRLVDILQHPNKLLGSQALELLLLATHPDMPPGFEQHQDSSSSSSSSDSSAEQPAMAQLIINHSSSSSPGSQQHDSSSSSATEQTTDLQSDSSSSSSTIMQQQHPSQGPDGRLWQQLAALHHSPLLANLLQLSPDVWPGSGSLAIQLMVFYLTWLRTWWSKDGTLQLSQQVLDSLKSWSTRAEASDTERELATQLLEDFGKAGPAPAAADGSSSSRGAVAFEPTEELTLTADLTQVNSSPGSEAERLKSAGNDAFRMKDWATAIKLYSAALDVPVPTSALLHEAPRRATHHTNRAAAYLERAWELQAAAAAAASSSGSSGAAAGSSSSSWVEVGGVLDGIELDGSEASVQQQLDAAIMDCKAALDLVPNHVKANYRLASALRARGDLAAAALAAAAAQQHAMSASDKAAAAKLAAAIKQQQQHEKNKPITVAAPKQSANKGNNGSTAAAAIAKEAAAAAAAADPVGQLLQNFTTALTAVAKPADVILTANRNGTHSDKENCIEDLQLSGTGAKQKARKQQQQQHQQQPSRGAKESASAGKVLIQVLAATDLSDPEDDQAQLQQQQQQQQHVDLDQLVEVLD